jgi:hypothetical protein
VIASGKATERPRFDLGRRLARVLAVHTGGYSDER